MREKKFRAWDKRDERMIIHSQEFIPLLVTSAGVFKLSPTHTESLYQLIPTDRFELMQYTGVRDFNEKEVYEDDILCMNKSKCVVRFKNGAFYLCHTNSKDVDGDFLRWSLLNRIQEVANYFEYRIIGNIHENPELLN